jgi:TetR/AcrR family transcriptional regulator, transcriptional repressor of aconitase
VVTEGTAKLGEQLVPILRAPEPPPLPELVERLLSTIVDFAQSEPGIDRLLVSLHGWSHSQSDPGLKAATRAAYRRLRELFADTVTRWQAAGTFSSAADPDGVAELLMSICLGFAAQRALTGDAGVHAHVSALEALASGER